ncbi:hypothetical protein CDD83_8336 [Cordyceps sp. RAO-2017]|nr:hypothetical protein CDD83_8336 [Cordyceps sp. RAO-2017]
MRHFSLAADACKTLAGAVSKIRGIVFPRGWEESGPPRMPTLPLARCRGNLTDTAGRLWFVMLRSSAPASADNPVIRAQAKRREGEKRAETAEKEVGVAAAEAQPIKARGGFEPYSLSLRTGGGRHLGNGPPGTSHHAASVSHQRRLWPSFSPIGPLSLQPSLSLSQRPLATPRRATPRRASPVQGRPTQPPRPEKEPEDPAGCAIFLSRLPACRYRQVHGLLGLRSCCAATDQTLPSTLSLFRSLSFSPSPLIKGGLYLVFPRPQQFVTASRDDARCRRIVLAVVRFPIPIPLVRLCAAP